MSRNFNNLTLGLDENLEEKLKLLSPDFQSYRILRKSVDARGRAPHWVYSVETYGPGEIPPQEVHTVEKKRFPTSLEPVLIIGAGPAGLFAALRLTERGIPCKLFERGSEAKERMRAIAAYWRYGELNPESNVCFGEGGAGLYSDGKLITRIKSPHIPYVLNRLVKFGAPEEIEYLANPHVGSDKIRKVIPPMREYLKSQGVEMFFDTRVESLIYEGSKVTGLRTASGKTVIGSSVILATGHSATDVINHLSENGVAMEGKSFAVGLRIEHPQKDIDHIQYKGYAGHPSLGAANYKLADHDERTGIGVYSFCMCPGGYVISSGTDPDSIVSNGMSNYSRSSPFANAAVVVSIDHDKHFGKDLFGGMKFRRELELAARSLVNAEKGKQQFPGQRVVDFMEGRKSELLPTSSPSGAVSTKLDSLFTREIYKRLSRSLESFQRKMPGFLSPRAQFFGVESRTSCPIRVIRHPETYESISHERLYPTGEGAGYAGGITSAAVDGVRVAEAICQKFSN